MKIIRGDTFRYLVVWEQAKCRFADAEVRGLGPLRLRIVAHGFEDYWFISSKGNRMLIDGAYRASVIDADTIELDCQHGLGLKVGDVLKIEWNEPVNMLDMALRSEVRTRKDGEVLLTLDGADGSVEAVGAGKILCTMTAEATARLSVGKVWTDIRTERNGAVLHIAEQALEVTKEVTK